MFLIPFPAYSPELNAMEQVWVPVKRHVSNAVWKTPDDMKAAITEVLRAFWEHAERVWSLLGDRPTKSVDLPARMRIIELSQANW